MKAAIAMMTIVLGFYATPVDAQILIDTLKNAISGPPSQADIAAARQEVQDAAQQALSALAGRLRVRRATRRSAPSG